MKAYTVSGGKPEENRPFQDLSVDGKINEATEDVYENCNIRECILGT
jgi:hypothetical protein